MDRGPLRGKKTKIVPAGPHYEGVFADVAQLVETARAATSRSVNSIMTATYWAIGRRIVEQEQHGAARAQYGDELVGQLSNDLTARFGRGFGRASLFQMRAFYLSYRDIVQTASGLSAQTSIVQTRSGQSEVAEVAQQFALPWSHYVRLSSVRNPEARRFYETEAVPAGWTARQLDRQIGSQFFERTALSKNKASMLRQGEKRRPEDVTTPGRCTSI